MKMRFFSKRIYHDQSSQMRAQVSTCAALQVVCKQQQRRQREKETHTERERERAKSLSARAGFAFDQRAAGVKLLRATQKANGRSLIEMAHIQAPTNTLLAQTPLLAGQ